MTIISRRKQNSLLSSSELEDRSTGRRRYHSKNSDWLQGSKRENVEWVMYSRQANVYWNLKDNMGIWNASGVLHIDGEKTAKLKKCDGFQF